MASHVTTNYTSTVTDCSLRAATIGGESTIDVTRVISRNDGAAIVVDTEMSTMISEGHLPAIDLLYVSTPVTGMTWEATARCRNVSLKQNGNKAVTASISYSTLWVQSPVGAATTVNLALPSSIEFMTRTRMTTVYRTGWSVAVSNTNASADIGGTNIAGGTQGITMSVPQIVMRMRFTNDSSDVPMSDAATNLSNYAGRLNSSTFITDFGGGSGTPFPEGSVLCEGVSIQKTAHEYYDITFEFVADNWYHLEQVATFDAKGQVKLDTSASAGAVEVKWKRMERGTANFNAIYSGITALKKFTETGWWM
jgi:hypothetical protein